MIKLRHLAAASAVVLTLAVAAPPASAQWIVYDPTNFSQNVLTAARELQQINNQITMLTNQATIAGQPGAQPRQPADVDADPASVVDRPDPVAAQARRRTSPSTSSASSRPIRRATVRPPAQVRPPPWSPTRRPAGRTPSRAFEDSLKVQAGVVGNIPTNSSAMTSLVTASQSATGALQAAQAGNQLLALQSQQLSDLVAVLSAKGRADALEQARTAAAEAQGQQNYKTFSTRTGYQPGNVTMFSGN